MHVHPIHRFFFEHVGYRSLVGTSKALDFHAGGRGFDSRLGLAAQLYS